MRALPNDLVARLEGKSSLGRLGLLIHSTAGYVDPGWDGYLTLELSNVANLPITLYPGMKIGQISFFRLTTEAETPYGARAASTRANGDPRRAGSSKTSAADSARLPVRLLVDECPRDRASAHLDGHHRGLCPVGDAELAEDRGQVGLDGLLRQVEASREVGVGLPLSGGARGCRALAA